ncbi:MAG: tetratricopeptide repeat protein, partial [Myxococcales bacterium]|nr:tetratricopeptide repeat protein [Myxococcales bacterium]
IEELKTFLETNPKELEGLVKLGHAYVQKGRYEEAMAVLEHAVAINKNYAPAYFFAGLAEYGRQRRKADDVERRIKAGETVRDADKPDFEKAIIAFTSARDRDPENLQYREMLARSLTESGKKRDLLAALEQYDTVIAGYRKAAMATGPKRPPSAEVYYSRGILASKLGRPREEVLKNFQDALLLDSERADYIARYGEELYRLQTRQQLDDKYVLEAKAYFTLVIDQFSKTHVRSNYYLGKIALLEWSRIPSRTPSDPLHKLALEHFQTVVAAGGDSEFPDVLFQIANIFRESEAYRLANQYYDKYLAQYRKVTGRPAPNERYVRELMRSSP